MITRRHILAKLACAGQCVMSSPRRGRSFSRSGSESLLASAQPYHVDCGGTPGQWSIFSPCSLLGAVWYLTVRRSWARAAEMRFPSRAVAKDLGREGEWRMTSGLHCARPTRSTDP